MSASCSMEPESLRSRHRLMAGALLAGAGKLGKGDDRHVQLLGHNLEISGNFGNFLNAVVDPFGARHQLQIVDDDEVDVAQAAQRLHFGHGDARRVVKIKLSFGGTSPASIRRTHSGIAQFSRTQPERRQPCPRWRAGGSKAAPCSSPERRRPPCGPRARRRGGQC